MHEFLSQLEAKLLKVKKGSEYEVRLCYQFVSASDFLLLNNAFEVYVNLFEMWACYLRFVTLKPKITAFEKKTIVPFLEANMAAEEQLSFTIG